MVIQRFESKTYSTKPYPVDRKKNNFCKLQEIDRKYFVQNMFKLSTHIKGLCTL